MLGYFSTSITHQTLTWSTGSLTCVWFPWDDLALNMFNQPTLAYYFSKLLSTFSWQWHGFVQIRRWFYDFERLLLCLQHCGMNILADSCCVCSTVVWGFWQTPVVFAALWCEDFDRLVLCCIAVVWRFWQIPVVFAALWCEDFDGLVFHRCGVKILTDSCCVCKTVAWKFWQTCVVLHCCGVKILADSCCVCKTVAWKFWQTCVVLHCCGVKILADSCCVCIAVVWGFWQTCVVLHRCGVRILTDSCCVCSAVVWGFWQTPVVFAVLWCEDFDRLVLCLQCCGVRILTDSCCVCSAAWVCAFCSLSTTSLRWRWQQASSPALEPLRKVGHDVSVCFHRALS